MDVHLALHRLVNHSTSGFESQERYAEIFSSPRELDKFVSVLGVYNGYFL
jgi:hypothetical protein